MRLVRGEGGSEVDGVVRGVSVDEGWEKEDAGEEAQVVSREEEEEGKGGEPVPVPWRRCRRRGVEARRPCRTLY